MNKLKTNMLLKVVSILLIIFGILTLIATIFAVVALAGFFSFGAAMMNTAAADAGVTVTETSTNIDINWLSIVGIVVSFIGVIVNLLAGIKGVKANAKNIGSCQILGFMMILFAVLSIVFTLLGASEQNLASMIAGFILPVLYLLGVFKQKALIAQNPEASVETPINPNINLIP